MWNETLASAFFYNKWTGLYFLMTLKTAPDWKWPNTICSIFLNRFLHLIKSNRKPQLKMDPLNKTYFAVMLVVFRLLGTCTTNNHLKCPHILDCHLLQFYTKKNKKKNNYSKIKAIMNSTIEPVNEKSHCVFSIIADCCKINGFDKTSQCLSLCSPVETLTLLGAAITASVSTLWQREE